MMNFSVLKICILTLIFCFLETLKATGNENVNIVRDFKIVLMYFSEAFLKGATFDGQSLEGDRGTEVAKDLVTTIETLALDYRDMPELQDLLKFKAQLEAGIPIAEAIVNSRCPFDSYLEAEAEKIQSKFITALNEHGGLVMPTGWKGHALAFVIKKGELGGTYDFAFINTGQGIENHYSVADPNEIYPALSKIWVEFSGVPGALLFGPKAWFFQGLIALRQEFLEKRLDLSFGKTSLPVLPEYFYGTFLANFRRYLVEANNERLVPMQRSGSCTLSSLMGALLYFSRTENTFYMYKLKLGHVLIKNFLSRARNDEKFKTLIKDGFESSGRKLFQIIGSSLAQKTLEYLEFTLPDVFKHAGLIGSERFKWLFDKKEAAIDALNNNPIIFENIRLSIAFIQEIFAFLSENEISISSNQIVVTNEIRSSLKPLIVRNREETNKPPAKGLMSDIYAYLYGSCDRLEKPIEDVIEFLEVLEENITAHSVDSKYFYRILNIFKRSRNLLNDDNFLDAVTIDQLLTWQERFRQLARSFAKTNGENISFDDIVFLAFLQNLSWKFAVAYDQKQVEEQRIGLAALALPQTLQSVLFGISKNEGSNEINVLAGNLITWRVQNSFDQNNVEFFMELLKREELKGTQTSRFMGPEWFSSSEDEKFSPDFPQENDFIYGRMMENPKVLQIYDQLKCTSDKWCDVNINVAKYLIVLSAGQELLYDDYPHYYNLMDTLASLRASAVKSKAEFNNERFWTKTTQKPGPVETSFSSRGMFSYHSDSYLSLMRNDYWYWNAPGLPKASVDGTFYSARHSLALTREMVITDIETWFNYVKNATSAKLFDSSYFQYTTDHLLNVPKFDKYGCVIFNIDAIVAENIIKEMSKLVELSMKTLREKIHQLTREKKKILIFRAVNVSIILARFISRIDSEKILTGRECAQVLARIYNLMVPFAKLDMTSLTEIDIARVNLALGHICTVSIRNSRKFMENIELETGQKGMRKTLKAYHWFVTKRSYVMTSVGKSVADDQFNYGISGSPLTEDETGFMKALLITYFLPKIVEDLSDLDVYVFRYNYEKFLVHMQNSNNLGEYVIINLWTGVVVKNGFGLLNNNIFINSPQFQSFFSAEDRPLASNGTAYEAGGRAIYYLPNFKGASYLIVRQYERQKEKIIIYRKWRRYLYELKRFEDFSEFYQLMDLNYDWIREDSLLYHRKGDDGTEEMMIFSKASIDPITRFIIKAGTNQIHVAINGFDSENGWEVIDRNKYFDYDGLADLIELNGHDSLKLQRHLDGFARGNYILAKDEYDRIVLILLGLRLSEVPDRPIVLREKDKTDETMESVFEILNISNTEICPNQSFNGGSNIPSGLIITSDSKKALLLVNSQGKPANLKDQSRIMNLSKSMKAVSNVEKIPILEDKLAPQSRKHKFLLAYYMILAYEFNSARLLLHPSSINHNDPFTIHEISISYWIAEINMEAPEVLALKLFVHVHYEINRSKFPLDHAEYSNKLRNLTEKLDLIPSLAYDYMFAVRELSEKYYIFKVFPEVLREPLFSKYFQGISEKMAPVSHNQDESLLDEIIKLSHPSDFKIGSTIYSGLFSFISRARENQENIEFISKFVLRRNFVRTFERRVEMALYCYVQEPSLWSEAFDIFTRRISLTDYNQMIKEISEQTMEKCIEKYGEDFKGINQSSGMTTTSLETLKSTMQAETNTLRLNNAKITSSEQDIPSSLMSSADIKVITDAEIALRNLLKSVNVPSSLVNFDDEIVGGSAILAKLKKSIRIYVEEKGQCPQSEIHLNLNQLEYLFRFFNEQILKLSRSQNESAAELVALTSAETISNVIGSILSLMHQKKAKTFESLYTCYFKDSLVCIQEKFPQLSFEECVEVKEKANVFYSKQILIDYFEMLNKSVDDFLKLSQKLEPVSVDDLTIFCDELSKIVDFEKRMDDPVIMNFEFRSRKYRLKPEQVKDVRLLTTKDQNNTFPSVVIQRMMAAGKTLVLGTISVVKKALNSKQLSILVPPSSLYQSNTTAMQARTYQYFKKKGSNFAFPRFSMPSKESPDSAKILENYLKTVLEIITNTMHGKNYLILSPDALHSFLNSYIEILLNAENNWGPEYKEILMGYANIYLMFKQRGSIILDEIDMTMDPKKELNFPTDETEPYNMVAVLMLTDIIEFMIFDDEIIAAGLRIHSNNQASLTAENYKKCIEIVLKYVKSQLINASSLWHKLIFSSKPHDEAHVNDIMRFLSEPNMAGDKEWITNFNDTGNEMVANALIIAKSQLHHHMEHSFKGTVNQNFGSAGNLRPEIKYAVPYAAANTPSAASVFADRWETLVKTLLMISASPCSLEIAKDFIIYARIVAIPSESVASGSLQATATYKNMKLILPEDLCPMSLDSENIIHVQVLQEALATRSPAAIRLLFAFYITQVFDKMSFPTEQITSNALNVASMFNSVQGYSGTIDNVKILPQHVVKDALEDHMRNEKNNGGISLKLVRDCNDGIVQELSEESFTKSAVDMISDLLNLYEEDIEDISAIIDTGAFFKNFKNIQVAKAILSACGRIKAVLYYDEDSNQLEFLRSNDESYTRGVLETSDPVDISRTTDVEIEKRFTFYDQRHITGSDILQPKKAHAIMTAGPRVLLRDILQGALRMRQFMTSQKVHLVTTTASHKFYCSKIKKDKSEMKASDLLTLGALNEDDKQEHENQKLAFAKINAEIRAFALDEISRSLLGDFENSRNFVIEMIKAANALFLRSIREVPLYWLQESKEENSLKIFNCVAVSRLHPFKKVMKIFASHAELQQRFNSVKRRIKFMISESNQDLYYAKEYIRTPIKLDSGTEVQQQTQTLTLVDLNMDQLIDNMSTRRSEFVHKYDLLNDMIEHENEAELSACDSCLSLENLYNERNISAIHKPLLENILITAGNRVGVTQDLIKLVEPETNESNPYPIFSKNTFEGSHFLVQVFGNNLKVLLVSSKHASKILKNLDNVIARSKFWLCDLSGSVTATNDNGKYENVLDFIPTIQNSIFDLLIFNGSLTQILTNPNLKAIYENWLKSENFENRAIFLRLRMNVLMEKNRIFEDDDREMDKLKKLSMGVQNVSESFVDGYPKGPIYNVFESQKIKELQIISKKDVPQNHHKLSGPDEFNLISELELLYGTTRDENFERSEEPPFILGSEEIPLNQDIDLDHVEIPIKSTAPHPIIEVPEDEYSYSVTEPKEEQECKQSEAEVEDEIDPEIIINDGLADYEEPPLDEIVSNEINI